MAVIDAHHHLWERQRFSYPWLRTVPALDRDCRLPEYETAARAAGVTQSVFVQADALPEHGLQEARWALSLAADGGPIAGVIAWAPIELPELPQYLEHLGQAPGLKGIRRLIQSEPDPGFCARPEFVAGVQRLGPLGLSFDVCVYHHQLPAVIELARAVPDVLVILDHLGKPAIRDGGLDPWRQHLRELGQMPHVTAKVSGLATEADWRRWRAADLRPYFDAAVEAFGFDRLMFGSDWPVSTLAVGYQQWVDTVGELLAGTASDDRERLFAATARRVYRLAV